MCTMRISGTSGGACWTSFLCLTFIALVLLAHTCEVNGGPVSYIVQQGCLYLAHYVRDNYIILETTTPLTSDVNWATWTYDAAEARYMPPELTQALVQCGKAHAFYALQAPQWLLQHYNLTDTQNLVG